MSREIGGMRTGIGDDRKKGGEVCQKESVQSHFHLDLLIQYTSLLHFARPMLPYM